MSRRMEHRGACACDNNTGDGAGVMMAVPDKFYRKRLREELNIVLPPAGHYATGVCFLEQMTAPEAERRFEEEALANNLKVLCWRTLPTDDATLGSVARSTEPYMRQVFVVPTGGQAGNDFKRDVFVLRKTTSHKIPSDKLRYYICSLSPDTIVYKCSLFSTSVADVKQENLRCMPTIQQSNTLDSAFQARNSVVMERLLAHNGEINTLQGNVNLMRAREGVMQTSIFGDRLRELYPVVEPNLSDSGSVDTVLEFLVMAGQRTLPEAVMTMVPEAWQNNEQMSVEKRQFYQWSGCAMEPWDGPALLTFSDGRYIGAILDRNGLRPSRYYITKDNYMVMASEVGVLDIPSEMIVQKDEELKLQIARQRPLGEWLKEMFTLADLHEAAGPVRVPGLRRQDTSTFAKSSKVFQDLRLPLFGYSPETINLLLLPMVQTE
ncbi:hypothetical protein HPB50_000143 [Hyalomma asiaticum]|uniref:Uncharacterized protein n=1 Tax=Hyalomma asiaticum TaxID=266040 RepID=A0ACB7RXR6_HYAAI|nr:hypothetical protein HPB50_000143 [Hyalomma asiaticum]